MNPRPLRAIAEDYASHGLSILPGFPRSKVPLVEWKAYQYEPPSTFEREAMFSFEDNLNIGVVCGAASNNLAIIDAESKSSFTDQLKRCDRVGVADTWVDETLRGGHISVVVMRATQPSPKSPNNTLASLVTRFQFSPARRRARRRSVMSC